MFNEPRDNFSSVELHSDRLSNARDKINSLKPRERVALDNIDPHCFAALWEEFESDRKSVPAGGTGKLQVNYDSVNQLLEVTNLTKAAPAPAPAPAPLEFDGLLDDDE